MSAPVIQPDLPVGARTVGDLGALSPARALAILLLRDWLDGPPGQTRVWNGLASVIGAPASHRTCAGLDALVGLVRKAGRRPLATHGGGCRCLGADEAWWAELLMGDPAEREMLAALLLPAPQARLAGTFAAEAADGIRDAARDVVLRAGPAPASAAQTLH